ncbi:MAG TPA: MFS transporter [Actinocrinis sp.]|nr:MFS transporter [Actinocrinis sp.]
MSERARVPPTGPAAPGPAAAAVPDPPAGQSSDIPPGPGRPPAVLAPRGKPPGLWSNRDYLGLWTGDAVSSLGTSMSAISYPLLILFVTGSVARAGLITAASLVGSVATMLWGGALADRVSRRAILVVCPLVQAAAVGVVAVWVARGHSPIGLLVAAALVGGLAAGIRSGARVPALRRIVPKEQMAAASSQIQGRDMAAEFFGNPLGALLFTTARWVPFGADAASFLFSCCGVALIRRPLGPEAARAVEHQSMLADVLEGLRYVRAVPFLRFIATWAPIVNMIATGYFLLFIAVLKYRGAGPMTIGLTDSIALVGGITGAVLGPALLKRVRAKLVFLSGGWAFVVGCVLTAILPVPWEIGCSVFLVMLVLVPLNAALDSYEVRLVPDQYSGRVSAAVFFGAQCLQWVGPLLAGVLADEIGPPDAALVFAAALVPLALMAHRTSALNILDLPVDQVQEYRLPERPCRAEVAGRVG